MTRTRAVLTLVATLTTLQCGAGEEGTNPTPVDTPGTAQLSLATPHVDDGAVAFTLRGTGLTGVEAASPGYLLFSRPAGPNEVKVIVIGDLVAGPVARVHVPALNRLEAYSATVDQAAARDDALRPSVTGYQLALTAATP